MKAGNSFLRSLTFLGAVLVLAACSDQGERPSTRAPVVTGPPEAALVIRHDASGQAEPGWKWMKLDASQSKGYGAEIEDYYFVVRDAASGRVLPGPGQSGASVVRVLLPEGAYDASLSVRDENGEKHEISRPFGVGATQAETSPPDELEWKLGDDGETDPVVFHGMSGPLGLASSFTDPTTSSTAPAGTNASGASASSSKSVRGPTSTGVVAASGFFCSPAAGQVGNALGAATSITLAINAWAAVPVAQVKAEGRFEAGSFCENLTQEGCNSKYAKTRRGALGVQSGLVLVSSALKIKGSACAENSAALLDERIADLEQEVAGLKTQLDFETMVFGTAMRSIYGTIQEGLTESLETKTDRAEQDFTRVLADAALRDPDSNTAWQLDGTDLAVDLLGAAACDSASRACCAGLLPADSDTCSSAAQDEGPLHWLSESRPLSFAEDVLGSSGVDYVEDSSSKCTWDCWKQIKPDPTSALVKVLDGFKTNLYAASEFCTSDKPQLRAYCPTSTDPSQDPTLWPPAGCDPTNPTPSTCPEANTTPPTFNVVPVFDKYNSLLLSRYQRALNMLSRAHISEQLINVYNFNRYFAHRCSEYDPDIDWANASKTCRLLRGEDVDRDGNLDVDEDTNGNGVLDSGEDLDGDGILDVVNEDVDGDGILDAPIPVNLTSIEQYGKIGGTRYHFDMLRGCNGAAPSTMNEHHDAYRCAQHQLHLAYLAKVNFLVRHLLNYHFTDSPRPGVQKWPETAIEFPTELKDWEDRYNAWTATHQGAAAALLVDYATEVGAALPAGLRTPQELIATKLGVQTYGPGPNVAQASSVYQSPYLWDFMACVNDTLKAQATATGAFIPSEKCASWMFPMPDGQPLWGGSFDGRTLQTSTSQLATGTSCPASCQTCSDPFDDSVTEDDFVAGGMGLVDVNSVPTCGGYCAGADNLDKNAGYCGDYRYATGSYADCTSCLPDPPQSFDPNDPYSSLGSALRSCSEISITQSSTGVPQMTATCDDGQGGSNTTTVACASRQWGNSFGTLVCEGAPRPLQVSAPLQGNVRYCVSDQGPSVAGDFDNNRLDDGIRNTWDEGESLSRDINGGKGWGGAICDKSGQTGTVYLGKKYAASIGESVEKVGSGDRASLLQMISEAHIAVSTSEIPSNQDDPDFNCSSDDFKARFGREDPAPGFTKQCLCAVGNRLHWIRPAKTVSASSHDDINEPLGKEYDPVQQANLPYLACGNHDPVDSGPRIAWEYGAALGSQKGIQDDEPPMIFPGNGIPTNAPDTFEIDIGVRDTVWNEGTPIRYEVAFVNLFKSCGNKIWLGPFQHKGTGSQKEFMVQDDPNVALLNEGADYSTNWVQATLLKNKDHGTLEHAYADEWAADDQDEFYIPYLRFNGPGALENKTSVFASVMVVLPPLNGNQIQIPIDLVLQCSDNGGDECEGQSSCMHMVAHSDADWSSASQEERANALAKRGYICQTSGSDRRVPPKDENYTRQARMVCEVPDGRAFQIYLTQKFEDKKFAGLDVGTKRFAEIRLREVTDYLPGRP